MMLTRRRRTPYGRFARHGMYVPDLEAHRRYDEAVTARLAARYCGKGVHVWIGTAAGPVCSVCGRIQDFIQPKPETPPEEWPLFLAVPHPEEVA